MDSVCYSVPGKQKPSKNPSIKCNNVFGPRLYNSLPKYLRDIDSVKSEKFIFELNEYLEFFPDESIMPNYVTAARINSYLILGLKEFTKVEESPTRPWSRLEVGS